MVAFGQPSDSDFWTVIALQITFVHHILSVLVQDDSSYCGVTVILARFTHLYMLRGLRKQWMEANWDSDVFIEET